MTTNELLKTFKLILNEAAKVFGRQPGEITLEQFRMVQRGRISVSVVRAIGYVTLRRWATGGKSIGKDQTNQLNDVLKKVANYAA